MKKAKEEWILPTVAIKLVHDLLKSKTVGLEDFRKKRNYTKTREAWPAAIFILRKILIDGDLWYLRKNDIENSSDDIYVRKFEFKGNTVLGSPVLPIQVMRIMTLSPKGVVEAIKTKFADDLKGVSLVCHFLRDEVIYWKEINEEIPKLKPKLNDITLIGNIGGSKFIVGQVYPNNVITIVNIDLIRIIAPPMIEAEEVFKAEDTGLTKLGEALLTTELDMVAIKTK
ncbi:MAG: hypothetical protein Q8P87_00900 [bacterium]|nr:hypothetical protein [bacterium]